MVNQPTGCDLLWREKPRVGLCQSESIVRRYIISTKYLLPPQAVPTCLVVFFFPLSLLFFSRFSLHVLNFRPYVVGRSYGALQSVVCCTWQQHFATLRGNESVCARVNIYTSSFSFHCDWKLCSSAISLLRQLRRTGHVCHPCQK